MDLQSKEILRSMIERKAENILNGIDDIVPTFFSGNPAIERIAHNFVSAKRKEYLPKVQEYCDLLVETSCADPDITLEAAIKNAEMTLNDFITELIGNKLGFPAGTVSISL